MVVLPLARQRSKEVECMRKISIIGAGMVGASVAQRVAEKDLAHEVILVDVVDGLPQGKALDIAESSPVACFHTTVKGTLDFEEISGSGIVVVSSGLPRSPGMDRSDLLEANGKIIRTVCEQIKEHSPNAIVMMVTNPLDAMTWLAGNIMESKRKRVFGMAGILDSSRFRYFIARELKMAPSDIHTMLLGAHGDEMVPVLRYTNVAGIPLENLMSSDKIEALVERTRRGGAEVVELLQKGSAFHAPSAAIALMVEAVARDMHIVRTCSARLHGEYGLDDICLGVPVKLGLTGIMKVFELELTDSEMALFQMAAEHAKRDIEGLKKLGIAD
jgi:malate dehydrogenase